MQRYINTNLNFGSFFAGFFIVGISAYLLPNASFTVACLLGIAIFACFIFSLLVICFNHAKTNRMEEMIRESVDRKYTPYELIDKASGNTYDHDIESCIFLYERNGIYSMKIFGMHSRLTNLVKAWCGRNPESGRILMEVTADIADSPKKISESELADREIDKYLKRKTS